MREKLLRDQRRLAEQKLEKLAEDHPLREKYLAWIAALEEQLKST